jgi:uncharacterized protein (TIGR03435 family)
MQNPHTFRRTLLLATAGIVVISAVNALRAQAPATDTKPPAFEVASVKPNNSGPVGLGPNNFRLQPGGRLTITNYPLRAIVGIAYQVQDQQLVGAPDWLYARFDILAKVDGDLPPLPRPQVFDAPTHPVFPMLRSLLAERFKLMVHREKRELPIYALVMARADRRLGPQLKRSTTSDCAPILAPHELAQRDSSPDPTTRSDGARQCYILGTMLGNVAHVTGDSQSMPQLAQVVLSGWANRIVVDRTNLPGLFNFTLDVAPEQVPQLPASGAPAPTPLESDRPSFFTAVQEQLGLKLESTKGPVDVLVIDHVEQPTPD